MQLIIQAVQYVDMILTGQYFPEAGNYFVGIFVSFHYFSRADNKFCRVE